MTEEKQKKIYIFFTIIFVFMGIVMLFIPDKRVDRELSPRNVIKIYNHGNAYYSTDRVAKLIMEKNPVLQLVDVRSPEEYEKFSLEGAINIPLNELFTQDKRGRFINSEYLEPGSKVTVFYSNGDMKAAEAWTLAKRLHLEKVYILDGGLNNWIETIIKPEAPDEVSASPADYATYEFRKAASMYFGGGAVMVSSTAVKSPKKAVVKKKKAAAEEEGGC